MRRLVILTCLFIYAVASPTNVEEKKIEHVKPEEKTSDSIVLDIIEENEEETVQGRDMLQSAKPGKEVRKTIHIHSPNTPNINVMPTKYHITANMPTPPPYAQGFYGQGIRSDGLKSGKSDRSKPKNQVNIYVYFPNNTDSMMMNESRGKTALNSEMKEPGKDVTKEQAKEPVKQVIREDKKPGVASDTSATKPSKKPSYVIACPPGHVKILGACVEYDQD